MASPIDLAIVFGYLALMLLIGFLVSRKEDAEGYFVNNRRTRTMLLLTATISTMVGAGAIIGTASVTYQSGIGMGVAFAVAIGLGWLLVALFAKKIKAFGDAKKALTLGDFYAYRYSNNVRIAAALVIAAGILVWMAVQLVALGSMFGVLTGMDFRAGLLISAMVTIIYVSLGGIKSDFYTDAIQFWVMLLIFILLIPLGLSYIGGIGALASLPATHFSLFTFGGPVVFFGMLLLGIPFAIVGMDTWQRIYSATNAKTARTAMLLSAAINPVFYFAAALIGLIAAAAFTGINSDAAFFRLMEATLPAGLLGIGMVSLLAVIMSSLDSLIVMMSAIVAKDFYKTLIRPTATNEAMLKLGRITGFLTGLTALTVAYFVPDIIRLSIYGTTLLLIFAPALLGGLFWKRATAKAALLSIVAGFATAMALIPVLKEQGAVPAAVVSIIVFVAASYLTKHSATENAGLTKAAIMP